MTWASGSNLRDFDDRYGHVGVDGMIFDNRNEMEVVTKICQKSCKYLHAGIPTIWLSHRWLELESE
jgi:hypothetical protein